jgi:hypothetical protein
MPVAQKKALRKGESFFMKKIIFTLILGIERRKKLIYVIMSATKIKER